MIDKIQGLILLITLPKIHMMIIDDKYSFSKSLVLLIYAISTFHFGYKCYIKL
jgi:hypothetical protein